MPVIIRRLGRFLFTAAALVLLATTLSAVPTAAATTYVVDTSTDNAGLVACTGAAADCSLRGAIANANATAGADTIHFDIPGTDCPGGVCRLTITEGPLAITEQIDLDATTQPRNDAPLANVCATADSPSSMRVEILTHPTVDPSSTAFIVRNSDAASTIRGLAIGTDTVGGVHFAIDTEEGSGHHYTCNHLNLNAAGTGAIGVSAFHTSVVIEGNASGIIVGTNGDGVDDISERNVFGPGTYASIYVNANHDNRIAGNYFGFSADGATALGGSLVLIRQSSSGNLVGTNEDGISDDLERNYFTGHARVELRAASFLASNNRVVGNTFGMSPTGTRATSSIGVKVIDLSASATGYEIRKNDFAIAETGIWLGGTEVGVSVLVSDNTFGGSDSSGPYGNRGAITIQGWGSHVIRDNLILNSGAGGVMLFDTAGIGAGSRDNCLVGNYLGVDNRTGFSAGFENNWWGATDGPSDEGAGSGDPVSIDVDYTPWLDSPPAQCNTAPIAEDANYTVSEDADPGTVVGTVAATDDGTTLAYAVTAGDPSGDFAIDTATGELTVAKPLDYETTPTYALTVTVTDPFLSDTATVTVAVTDVVEPLPGPTFDDVPETDTFYADIEWLAREGITLGCNPPTNNLFCPTKSDTRGQMAAFLHRALEGTLTPGPTVGFVDDDGSVFETDIEWLAAVEVTLGCNPPANDPFCPEEAVTRGQMAAFLVRALGLTESGTVDFVDDKGSVFEADIEKLATAEVTRGCNPPANDRFCPNNTVTRAQMAAFLNRALG